MEDICSRLIKPTTQAYLGNVGLLTHTRAISFAFSFKSFWVIEVVVEMDFLFSFLRRQNENILTAMLLAMLDVIRYSTVKKYGHKMCAADAGNI
jgi:hypothetical protein